MAQRRSLGKGLGALLPQEQREPEELPLEKIKPNPGQPRKTFPEENLRELAESIKEHGLLQPILVKKQGDESIIVAGERRWRAAALAGIKSIPVRFFHGEDREILEISLVENLQREDLSPLEVAASLKEMIQGLSLTQEEVAKKISWKRSTVANKLRLLDLPVGIRELMDSGAIAEGHGRALLSVTNDEAAIEMATKCAQEGWSVRTLEQRIRAQKADPPDRRHGEIPPWGEDLKRLRIGVSLHQRGGKVKLTLSGLTKTQADKIGELLSQEKDRLFPGK